MFKIIAVSNRHLCEGDFTEKIKEITSTGTEVILREKDLCPSEYARLLKAVGRENIIPHTFYNEAEKEGHNKIHLPLHILRENPQLAERFSVGVSIHSAEEAKEAEKLGAVYITAGHIFATDCKKGLPGRGIGFLEQVKRAVSIPVYAIGGIGADNIDKIKKSGADGACIMSGFMRCKNYKKYLKELRDVLHRN